MALANYKNKGIRIFLVLLSIPLALLLLFFIFGAIGDYLYPKYTSGTYDLGNGLYLYPRLERDSDLGIVLATNVRGKACYGGYELIPDNSAPDDTHRRSVIDVRADNRWVIAIEYDFDTGAVKYFVIDKSFDKNCSLSKIKEDYIVVFEDIIDFKQYCYVNSITLSFNDRQTLVNKSVM